MPVGNPPKEGQIVGQDASGCQYRIAAHHNGGSPPHEPWTNRQDTEGQCAHEPRPILALFPDYDDADEQGWRQFSHSQLMTDEMRQQMREIVAAVTSQLANTESKANNPDAYRKCLHRLDKTLPRYKKRGGNIDNFLLKEEQN